MKNEKPLHKGKSIVQHLDDLKAPEIIPLERGVKPDNGYMETWDVLEAPTPSRGVPLPEDEED